MKFEVSDLIAHPVSKVYPVFRDHIADLAQYLPNVKRIEIIERKEEGGLVHVTSDWYAQASLPNSARKFFPENKLGWRDVAAWNTKQQSVDWHFVLWLFTEAVHVSGHNAFTAEGKQTRLTINGEWVIDPAKIRGIPNIILRGVIPTVEKFAFALVKPNLLKVNRAVEKLLSEGKIK